MRMGWNWPQQSLLTLVQTVVNRFTKLSEAEVIAPNAPIDKAMPSEGFDTSSTKAQGQDFRQAERVQWD